MPQISLSFEKFAGGVTEALQGFDQFFTGLGFGFAYGGLQVLCPLSECADRDV